MSENWKIQVSPKVGDALVNLRAENPDEAERMFAWAIANASLIVDTVKTLGGVVNVNAALGGTVVEQAGPAWSGGGASTAQTTGGGWSQQGSQQSTTPPAPQGGKQCVHGPMVAREGTSAKGPWKGFFCPLPQSRKSEQCSPEFQR